MPYARQYPYRRYSGMRPYNRKRYRKRRSTVIPSSRKRLVGDRLPYNKILKYSDCYGTTNLTPQTWTNHLVDWNNGVLAGFTTWNGTKTGGDMFDRLSKRIGMTALFLRHTIHSATTSDTQFPSVRIMVIYAKRDATPTADAFLASAAAAPGNAQVNRFNRVGDREPYVILSDKTFRCVPAGDANERTFYNFKQTIKFSRPLIADYSVTTAANPDFGGLYIFACSAAESGSANGFVTLHTNSRLRFYD